MCTQWPTPPYSGDERAQIRYLAPDTQVTVVARCVANGKGEFLLKNPTVIQGDVNKTSHLRWRVAEWAFLLALGAFLAAVCALSFIRGRRSAAKIGILTGAICEKNTDDFTMSRFTEIVAERRLLERENRTDVGEPSSPATATRHHRLHPRIRPARYRQGRFRGQASAPRKRPEFSPSLFRIPATPGSVFLKLPIFGGKGRCSSLPTPCATPSVAASTISPSKSARRPTVELAPGETPEQAHQYALKNLVPKVRETADRAIQRYE